MRGTRQFTVSNPATDPTSDLKLTKCEVGKAS